MKKSWKKVFAAAAIAAMALSMAACGDKPAEETTPAEDSANGESQEAAPYKVGILQLVEHDALDSARNGFLDALAEGGYADGEKITVDQQNAQNDQSNLKTMSQKFVNDDSDLILAIATPSAQSAATETTEIPILGTAITDYVEAGLVTSSEEPGGNVSGTSDKTPVKEQFDLMMKILPDTKTVGIMYNSSEANSEVQFKLAEEAATNLGLTVIPQTVTNANDIPQAVQSLLGKVDAIYIPTDNTFASAMANVSAITNEAKMPVIVGENGMCKAGGLATIGIDYYKLGQQTGKMAIRVLEGEDITKMPIEYPESTDICVNLDTAKAIGVEIPQDIIDSAAIVIEDGQATDKNQ